MSTKTGRMIEHHSCAVVAAAVRGEGRGVVGRRATAPAKSDYPRRGGTHAHYPAQDPSVWESWRGLYAAHAAAVPLGRLV